MGANTISSLVTAKYTNNSKENNNETSVVIFTILRHSLLGLMESELGPILWTDISLLLCNNVTTNVKLFC